jgi:hypothetical protein
MPTISTCPRCSQMVSIPPEVDSSALVRCPLCGAEYPLGAAMDSPPPELVPVERGNGEASRAADGDANVAPPPIISPFLPGHDEETEHGAASETDYASGEGEEVAAAPDGPLDDEVYDLIARHKQRAKEESQNGAGSPSATAGSRRKEKSELRIFVEIVFGGILGLAITYVALAWIMGSKFPLPAPPTALKPVLRFVLPDQIWAEKR